MAFKFAVRPPFSLQFFHKRKLPLRIQAGKYLLFHSMHTQAAQGIAAKPFKEIPGPKGLPIIGTLLDYVRDQGEGIRGYKRMHVMQQQRIQQFGSIYREKIVNYETVAISNPDDVQFLFRNEGKHPTRQPVFPLWMKYKEEREQPLGLFNL